jgi:hypothetical protein
MIFFLGCASLTKFNTMLCFLTKKGVGGLFAQNLFPKDKLSTTCFTSKFYSSEGET